MFIEWSNCFCFLDFASYFSQPEKRRDEPGFFQPRGSLSPHHTGLHLKRPTTSNRYNPPSSFIPGSNFLFNSYSILFRSARTIVPVGGLFRVLLYFEHIQLTATTPSFTSQRDLLESGSLVVVKLHYRKACFDSIILYRFAKPFSNLLSIKDTFATDRLATC